MSLHGRFFIWRTKQENASINSKLLYLIFEKKSRLGRRFSIGDSHCHIFAAFARAGRMVSNGSARKNVWQSPATCDRMDKKKMVFRHL
ncbi:MAG: hypothetical protein IJI53_13235 [Clostridia bacterium]|nr:hypothetical protein [Clostridia bacterium]